jgi:hypothetical protein
MLLGRIAIALLGFGINDTCELWPCFIIVGFITMHNKIIVFNWNMERQPEKTVLPQDSYGSDIG